MIEIDQWQRLDVRTLLTGSLNGLRQAGVPLAAGAIGIAASQELLFWALIGLPIAAVISFAVGALPWLTTRFRVTSSHLEINTGLIFKKSLSARRDRVRSVDLEAPLIHRAVGAVRVRIGTGVDEGQITLDALRLDVTEDLRRILLLNSDTTPAPNDDSVAEAPGLRSRLLAKVELSWLRFAPLNLVHLGVVLGAIAAFASQAQSLIKAALDTDAAASVRTTGSLLLIAVTAVIVIAVWVITACLTYFIRWYNLKLTRELSPAGEPSLHQRAGLLTTRSITVEESKVRGVQVRRQLLMAAAGGSDLSVMTIGLENNSPSILPPAPHTVVTSVAADILGDAEPVHADVIRHGRKAMWRHVRRGLWSGIAVLAVAVVVCLAMVADDVSNSWAIVMPIAGTLATLILIVQIAAYRQLGHARTERHIVSRTGAVLQRRTILESDGIVGWKIYQNPFDKHLTLATLTATTPAGDEAVVIDDIHLADAIGFANDTTPELLREFVVPARPTAQ